MIRHAWDTMCGLFALLRLGVITRFRFKGPYWQWRLHTAYGQGMPPTRRQLIRDVLEYARWMHRVRR